MNYLKTAAEVIAYCPRTPVPTSKELVYSNICSRLIDAYCGRTLSIRYYLLDFELSRALAGQVPMRPIIEIAPTTLPTGLAVRPLKRHIAGGRELLGEWQDITIPDNTASLLNTRTGRLEIYSSILSDYGRLNFASSSRAVYAWLAKIEIQAGLFVDTTLSATAASGATSVTLATAIGVTAGVTRVNFGDSNTPYTVTALTGLVATISPALVVTATLPIGTAVSQVVPEEIKMACAMTIEDRLTYEPNTLRQTSTLDVISERFMRTDLSPIPVDAQRLLAMSGYRN